MLHKYVVTESKHKFYTPCVTFTGWIDGMDRETSLWFAAVISYTVITLSLCFLVFWMNEIMDGMRKGFRTC